MTHLIRNFSYELPQRLIAQKPVSPRDACRLLVLDRTSGGVVHDRFFHLGNYLKRGDVLVFNESKVIPARLHVNVSGKEVELFLTRKIGPSHGKGEEWLCLGKPGKVLKVGVRFEFGKGLQGDVLALEAHGQRKICVSDGEKFDRFVREYGQTPLPPYITGRDSLPEEYQTVFAREEGSVAAPTAGLHFTQRLLGGLRHKGVQTEFVTLHVGIGTFLPVKTKRLEEHVMHSEEYMLDSDTARRLTEAKKEGRRIIAVGTTSVRVLESAFDVNRGEFMAGKDEAALFIRPGYKWKCVDGLVTNFHLPKSTLLVLVSSFAGRERILKAYEEAVQKGYRFFSFGDAMFII